MGCRGLNLGQLYARQAPSPGYATALAPFSGSIRANRELRDVKAGKGGLKSVRLLTYRKRGCPEGHLNWCFLRRCTVRLLPLVKHLSHMWHLYLGSESPWRGEERSGKKKHESFREAHPMPVSIPVPSRPP